MSKTKSFWSFSAKDIVYILIIIALGVLGWKVYRDLKAQVQESQVAFRQLSDELARAQNELATKAELNQMAQDMDMDLDAIKRDLAKLGADINAVGETVASIEGSVHEDQGSDDTQGHDPGEQPENCKLCDVHGYTAETQIKNIQLGEMPYGKVSFDASENKPWTLQYDDIDVNVKTVVGKQDKENGLMIFYHTITTTNKSRPDLADKEYKLKITSSEFKQTLDKTKEWYWWAPKVDLQVDGLLLLEGPTKGRFGASLGLSAMGYGYTGNRLDWRILRVGVGLHSNEQPYLSMEPVKYNIGKHIPLIDDLWIGAGATWDGHWGGSLSIGTTL